MVIQYWQVCTYLFSVYEHSVNVFVYFLGNLCIDRFVIFISVLTNLNNKVKSLKLSFYSLYSSFSFYLLICAVEAPSGKIIPLSFVRLFDWCINYNILEDSL